MVVVVVVAVIVEAVVIYLFSRVLLGTSCPNGTVRSRKGHARAYVRTPHTHTHTNKFSSRKLSRTPFELASGDNCVTTT